MGKYDIKWALAGIGIALFLASIALYANYAAGEHHELRRALGKAYLLLWPPSFMIMATYGKETTVAGITVAIVAVLLNGLLYTVYGRIVSSMWRIASR
jgi:hypothetical protein